MIRKRQTPTAFKNVQHLKKGNANWSKSHFFRLLDLCPNIIHATRHIQHTLRNISEFSQTDTIFKKLLGIPTELNSDCNAQLI